MTQVKKASAVLPPEFVARVREIYPGRDGEAALAAFEKPRGTTLRPNRLKTDARTLRRRLEEAGFKLENLPYPPDAFLLRNRRQRDLEETAAYSDGELYLQNPSSMVPPHLLAPTPGMAVLDLAAAPGGKTTQLASMLGGEGRLVACEENPVRAEKLRATLRRQGATFVEVQEGDGAVLARRMPEAFDRVLLDAPCSAEGRFDSGEPSSYRYWKEDVPAKAARLQRRLFKGAFEALKPGGMLVYSTCAVSPEENEGMVAWALAQYAGRLIVLPSTAPTSNARPGLRFWRGNAFPADTSKSMRLLPTQVFEGFYVCLFRKTAPDV